MKRLISMILVMALLLSLSIAVYAVDDCNPHNLTRKIGDGTIQPLAVDKYPYMQLLVDDGNPY